jgi:tungstate transport system substrate-binding protein
MKHSRAVGVALVALFFAAGLLVVACGSDEPGSAVDQGRLLVATTTSLNDSGLLDDVVLPAYERRHPGVTVKVVAVGSGEAIAMGAQGDADVLLVHSPDDEAAFMAEGHGTLRLPFAYNYFVIAGPEDDPAGISRAETASDAFAAIAESQSTFVSRGDESGTNKKELKLWDAAGVTPEGDWYLSAGQGMGETLRIASEKQAYTLTDLGTLLAQGASLDLKPLFTGSGDLKNVYDVIIVNQNEFPMVNAAGAEDLAQLLVSADGQKAIAAYGEEEYGEPLFQPFAGGLGAY